MCRRGAPARHGKPPGQPSADGYADRRDDSGYKLGQRVRHAKFGEGTIVNMEGSGEHSRLQVGISGPG
ncbi:hypothetical protein ACNKHR_11955 [Shigella flexneri]